MQKEKLQKQLSEFQLVMSKFAHEIRNPLTLIQCQLQHLTDAHPEAEAWKEISDIQDHLLYMKELIHEFSDYSNAGRISLKPSDIHTFLYNTAESFRPVFEYLNIRLITDFPSNLPEIPADTLRLRQAITNLLRNAQESVNHDHGEIIFSADMADSYLCISVRDNGCGISAEHLNELGTPFITHKKNGTGLGLSITRQIIESHGGHIKIESTPSLGTSVHLYLPSSRMV